MDFHEFQKQYIELLDRIEANPADPESMQFLHTLKAEAFLLLKKIKDYHEIVLPPHTPKK